MRKEELEKMLEEVCNDCCESCPLRKECEAYQSGAYEAQEITPETLKAGMTFEGVGEWNAGEWIRVTAVDGERVYMSFSGCGDSCDREYFPGLNPAEWKYTGIAGENAGYLIA